jgi:hypothetical protein
MEAIDILVATPFFLMVLCFIAMEISNRKYEKSRDRYIKWIISNWNK